MNKQRPTLTFDELHRFTTDRLVFEHSLNPCVVFTPGVLHVAKAGHAHWLIDAIASQLTPERLSPYIEEDRRISHMHIWQLTVANDQSASLAAFADTGCTPFLQQAISWTDFPLESLDIWAISQGRHWTLLLPSEY